MDGWKTIRLNLLKGFSALCLGHMFLEGRVLSKSSVTFGGIFLPLKLVKLHDPTWTSQGLRKKTVANRYRHPGGCPITFSEFRFQETILRMWECLGSSCFCWVCEVAKEFCYVLLAGFNRYDVILPWEVPSDLMISVQWDILNLIIATSAEVNWNGGLVREFPQHARKNSGLGIIVSCPHISSIYLKCQIGVAGITWGGVAETLVHSGIGTGTVAKRVPKHPKHLTGYDWSTWVFLVFWAVVSNMFYFHPYLGKMNPFWRAYFSDGLKPPPSFVWRETCF